MESYIVAPTKSSPEIVFNAQTNQLVIRGESYPENCALFYKPMFEWLENYLNKCAKNPTPPEILVDLEILYFNSSSSKAFMDFFDALDDAAAKGIPITVNWHFHEENDTAEECGEEFQEDVLHMQFNVISSAS